MTAPATDRGRILADIYAEVARDVTVSGNDLHARVAELFVERARLVPIAEVDRVRDGSLADVRSREALLEQATQRRWAAADEARQQYEAKWHTVQQDIAALIRRRADNPQYVTGVHKRRGVLLVAEWLDPTGGAA